MYVFRKKLTTSLLITRANRHIGVKEHRSGFWSRWQGLILQLAQPSLYKVITLTSQTS